LRLLDTPAYYRDFGRVFDDEDLEKGLLLRERNRTGTAVAPTLLLPPAVAADATSRGDA
jgi:hypothetical protein